MSVAMPSAFERLHFDQTPVTVARNGLDVARLVGFALTDDDIANLSGAPGGSNVSCVYKPVWFPHEIGSDRPQPGLYFYVDHPSIPSKNCIGLCLIRPAGAAPYFIVYVKDVSFVSGSAPPGLAGAMIARMARRCTALGVNSMWMLAAGGREWADMVPGQRWTGYAAWARYGFDMPLIPSDVGLLQHFPYYPSHLKGPPACTRVQEVVKTPDGMEWWKMCGTGHFMSFDCSNLNTTSVAVLDSALASKGI
jgi:hypothetical protein